MTKTLQTLPFFRILIPFIVGIYIQYTCAWNLGPVVIACAFFALVIALIPHISGRYSTRWVFGFLLACFCLFSGYYLTQEKMTDQEWNLPEGVLSDYEVKLLEDPVLKPKSMMCKANIQGTGKNVIFYLSLDTASQRLSAGDHLFLRAAFKKPEKSLPGNSFDYADYLKKHGFSVVAFVSNDNWSKCEHKTAVFIDIKSAALACRRLLLNELKRIIPDKKYYSVAAAIILGYQDAIDKDIRTSFSATGASHVLSVSGLHTGILYGMLYFLLTFLGRSYRMKFIRQVVILMMMWSFAFITGLSPSVVRATIMLSFVGIGGLFGKKASTLNVVGASAFFMLLYNPMYIFDVGFQLSYLAVVSIIVFSPALTRLFSPKHVVLKYSWELTCVSTAAQLGTTPLTIYYFHQFPVLFLITNLFVVPLSGILLILLFFALIISVLLPVPIALFKPLSWVINFFISGVQYIENIPYSVVSGLAIDWIGVITLYSIFCSAGILLIRRKIVYLYLLGLLVAFQLIYYL